MQDEVDLLNANDIVSISVNQNKLKQVFLMMMTKMNQHATKILKLENNYKNLQQSTEKSIYNIQQRIIFNEKETQSEFSKVHIVINQNKLKQEGINSSVTQHFHDKDNKIKHIRGIIEQVGNNLDSKISQNSKSLINLCGNYIQLEKWKQKYQIQSKQQVNKLRDEVSSIHHPRISYTYNNTIQQQCQSMIPLVPKPRHRNSQFIMKRNYLQRSSKVSSIMNRHDGIGSGKTLTNNPHQRFDTCIENKQQNQFVKQKLSCIQEQLQRQRRIVDRKLISTVQERAFTESSRDNARNEKTDSGSRITKRFDPNQQLRKQVLKTIKQMQGKMNECKVPQQLFTKTITNINQKINLLEMLVITKCDKVQVKNAFTFLQKKLKQLILVVANNEVQQKDALITKQQAIKCMSCSHFVEKQNQKVQFTNWKLSKGSQLNYLLQMKNDFRNMKQKQNKMKRFQKKTPTTSHHQKRTRPQSKSMVYSNTLIAQNLNK